MKSLKSMFVRAALVLSVILSAFSTPAMAQAFTDYAENRLVDALFRGQSLGAPATWYVGLLTSACSDSSAGTEVSGGSYARVGVTASLANFAGTQSAGSTTASSGTGGQTSNNIAVTWSTAPTANWGVVTHYGMYDASTAGNLWLCVALSVSKTINNGDAAPSFAIGAATVTIQ